MKDEPLYSYKELDVGQFFFRTYGKGIDGGYYGIKLSAGRYFNLDANRVCGFADGKINDSDAKRYIKCEYEVWNETDKS